MNYLQSLDRRAQTRSCWRRSHSGRPTRVTVLVEDSHPDWATDESAEGRAIRDRLALLLSSIETRTGAVVVGLAGNREQLRGWRFDRIVSGGRIPVAA